MPYNIICEAYSHVRRICLAYARHVQHMRGMCSICGAYARHARMFGAYDSYMPCICEACAVYARHVQHVQGMCSMCEAYAHFILQIHTLEYAAYAGHMSHMRGICCIYSICLAYAACATAYCIRHMRGICRICGRTRSTCKVYASYASHMRHMLGICRILKCVNLKYKMSKCLAHAAHASHMQGI